MANDLDDFLKRAAQRRAQNKAVKDEQKQRQQSRPVSPPPREYTDRSRERTPTILDDDEEVIVAEVVPANSPVTSGQGPLRTLRESSIGERSLSNFDSAKSIQQTDQVFEARMHKDLDHKVGRLDDSPGFVGNLAKTPPSPMASASLLRLLKTPDGVRQAFLLREILDRPVDRW